MNLVDRACDVMKKAYAPYSKFTVGCAVVGDSGSVYEGCNVENASYGGAICAERVAITHAVACGEKKIKELVLIASCPEPCMPCGLCLQVMAEFAGPDLKITSYAADRKTKTELRFKDLLPHAFTKSSLKSGTV